MPKIIIKRKYEWVNMSDAYTLFLNGKKKKNLRRGDKRVLKVKPGSHRIKLKMDSFSSPEVELNIQKGETKIIETSGFLFQEYILPFYAISLPAFFVLKNSGLISAWLALPLFVPVTIYAAYHYFIKTGNYIRVSVKDKD